MINARFFLPGVMMLSLVATSYGSDSKSAQESSENQIVTIQLKDMRFVPNTLVVSTGTTVNWINLDPVDHDVTSGVSVVGRKSRGMKQTKFPDNKFSSGLFGKDKTFSMTFDEKGKYQYYCDIHPFMIASVIVK